MRSRELGLSTTDLGYPRLNQPINPSENPAGRAENYVLAAELTEQRAFAIDMTPSGRNSDS